MPFSALIPTAGRSSRMGTPKAWLDLDGEPFLARIVRSACEGGAMAVVVVAGAEEEAPGLVSRIEVATRIQLPPDVRLSVAIGDPDSELVASIRLGLDLVQEGSDVLLWPVDAPFAGGELVARLNEAAGRDRIAVPVVGTERCHPILIGEQVANELTGESADGGAHLVVDRDPARIVEVAARDPRLTKPLNTPAEARALGIVVP